MDPAKDVNRDATEQDFWRWVASVEEHHQQAVVTAELLGAARSEFPTHELADASSGNTLYVGNGGYRTIQAAVDAVPSGGGRYNIHISSGTYL